MLRKHSEIKCELPHTLLNKIYKMFRMTHEITFHFRIMSEYARNQTIHVFTMAKW
ncbi:hypothetical protein ECP03047772_2317 [Escherichia coli P0304777.2]|nr:hypothetical protein FORC28_1774 [Escherichia coli]EFZ62422.1 hypothetical protein ECOK1180_4197 [Escherichia coli OK1180]EGB40823.1 hypothetical protein EREG_03506 [Escherichia coli H120]EGJ04305.1 hypothetical protein SSJG_00353 [Escherichia coli D9]EGW69964.1 hypothetical protein ECSTECB2F1_2426 [Escherichia coli O91:H21 str. B2F1]EHY03438.1 hypothetical protein ECDEC15B_2674 [Escherichia coli DEC15B]EMV72048.1 hypothetical protein EC2866550_2619 [Escherichia coli 2866550]EMV90365.1 hy